MRQRRISFILENYIYTLVLAATVLFLLGYKFMSSRNFLLILNGVYIGQMVAIVMVFGAYFFYVLFTHDPYTRARQYAINSGLKHAAYLFVVTYSITNRRYGGNTTIGVDWQLLLSRYLILIAGFLELTAPDLGKPALFGVTRKVLVWSSFCGLIAACAIIWLQFHGELVAPAWLYDLLGLGD